MLQTQKNLSILKEIILSHLLTAILMSIRKPQDFYNFNIGAYNIKEKGGKKCIIKRNEDTSVNHVEFIGILKNWKTQNKYSMTCVELRNMNCELGPLSRPDGSALFTLGESMTVSAVYGPVEVKPQKLLIENAYIEVTYKPRIGLPSVADKLKEATLTNVFKTAILSSQYPRTSISIIVQEMQDSGGLLACSINCACLALLNAGIPLKFLVAAVSCMITKENEIILDPDLTQLKENKATFVLVFDSIDRGTIATETSGTYSAKQFAEVLETCREASTKIFKFYRDVVKKSVFDKINYPMEH